MPWSDFTALSLTGQLWVDGPSGTVWAAASFNNPATTLVNYINAHVGGTGQHHAAADIYDAALTETTAVGEGSGGTVHDRLDMYAGIISALVGDTNVGGSGVQTGMVNRMAHLPASLTTLQNQVNTNATNITTATTNAAAALAAAQTGTVAAARLLDGKLSPGTGVTMNIAAATFQSTTGAQVTYGGGTNVATGLTVPGAGTNTWTLYALDDTGTLQIVQSTAQASPVKPNPVTLGTNWRTLGYVFLRNGATSIKTADDGVNGYIVEGRSPFNGGTGGAGGTGTQTASQVLFGANEASVGTVLANTASANIKTALALGAAAGTLQLQVLNAAAQVTLTNGGHGRTVTTSVTTTNNLVGQPAGVYQLCADESATGPGFTTFLRATNGGAALVAYQVALCNVWWDGTNFQIGPNAIVDWTPIFPNDTGILLNWQTYPDGGTAFFLNSASLVTYIGIGTDPTTTIYTPVTLRGEITVAFNIAQGATAYKTFWAMSTDTVAAGNPAIQRSTGVMAANEDRDFTFVWAYGNGRTAALAPGAHTFRLVAASAGTVSTFPSITQSSVSGRFWR